MRDCARKPARSSPRRWPCSAPWTSGRAPVTGSRSRWRAAPGPLVPSGVVYTILSVVQVFFAIVLIFLVLMHSGKDAGLSGAFGVGTGAGPFGGGSLVERNLNRWTVVFAVLFAINTIVLLRLA